GEREIAEAGAELLIVQPFGKQLYERAHGDQRIADLVRDARRERAEDGEAIGASQQLAGPHEVVLELRPCEERARPVDELARERARLRRQRPAAGRGEQGAAERATRRLQDQHGAPGTGGRLAGGIQRRQPNGPPRGAGNLDAADRLPHEERGSLEPEGAREQLEEDVELRRLSADRSRPRVPWAPRAGGIVLHHTQPPPPSSL